MRPVRELRFLLLGTGLILGPALGLWASPPNGEIRPGACQTSEYIPLLRGMRVAVVCNQSSRVGSHHLLEVLRDSGVQVRLILSPEHGLRGLADAGEPVGDNQLEGEGIRVVSLYGPRRELPPSELRGIDWVIFDLQDVGVRCYTYLSTLHHVMRACAQTGTPLLVLDRPNPNGHYIDGPVLEPTYRSFVGMHPVPWVHGMTVGEYARMIDGEGWLGEALRCTPVVVRCMGYDHSSEYILPTPPSPNLRTQNAVYQYASLAWFEGTTLSVGRGTAFPFEVVGGPTLRKHSFHFTPKPGPGAKRPILAGQPCHGYDLRPWRDSAWPRAASLRLDLLLNLHRELRAAGKKCFTPFFDRLAGTQKLRKSIEAGRTEAEIRASWAEDLAKFQQIRKKYLLYPLESTMPGGTGTKPQADDGA